MNRRSKTILFSGSTVLIATIVTTLLCIKSWNKMSFATTAFTIWAELSFFLILLTIEHMSRWAEQVFLRSSLLAVSFLYSCFAIIVSLVFLNILPQAFTAFWVVQILLLMISAVLFFVICAASKSIRAVNDRTAHAVTQTESMMRRLDMLAASVNNRDTASALRALSDQLRYTDVSVVVSADTDIEKEISSLETEYLKENNVQTADAISKTITALNSLIAKRKLETAAAKEGGI